MPGRRSRVGLGLGWLGWLGLGLGYELGSCLLSRLRWVASWLCSFAGVASDALGLNAGRKWENHQVHGEVHLIGIPYTATGTSRQHGHGHVLVLGLGHGHAHGHGCGHMGTRQNLREKAMTVTSSKASRAATATATAAVDAIAATATLLHCN